MNKPRNAPTTTPRATGARRNARHPPHVLAAIDARRQRLLDVIYAAGAAGAAMPDLAQLVPDDNERWNDIRQLCKQSLCWRCRVTGAGPLRVFARRDDMLAWCSQVVQATPAALVRPVPEGMAPTPDAWPYMPGQPRPGTMNDRALKLIRNSGCGATVEEVRDALGLAERQAAAVIVCTLGNRGLVYRVGQRRGQGYFFPTLPAADAPAPTAAPRVAGTAAPAPAKPERAAVALKAPNIANPATAGKVPDAVRAAAAAAAIVRLHSLSRRAERAVGAADAPVRVPTKRALAPQGKADYSRAVLTQAAPPPGNARWQNAPGEPTPVFASLRPGQYLADARPWVAAAVGQSAKRQPAGA